MKLILFKFYKLKELGVDTDLYIRSHKSEMILQIPIYIKNKDKNNNYVIVDFFDL